MPNGWLDAPLEELDVPGLSEDNRSFLLLSYGGASNSEKFLLLVL